MSPRPGSIAATKTYDIPASWSDLRGPSEGTLLLPLSIHWGPQQSVDLSDLVDVGRGYRSILVEGTAEQQAEMLNAGLLESIWPDTLMPVPVRVLWSQRFPEHLRMETRGEAPFGGNI